MPTTGQRADLAVPVVKAAAIARDLKINTVADIANEGATKIRE
jgi:hypothetical protein